jgi:hypothetical protein
MRARALARSRLPSRTLNDVVDPYGPACSAEPAEPPIVRLLLGPKLRPGHEKTPGSRSWTGRFNWSEVVVRGGVEPPTFRFSGGRSYQLSYLTVGADGTAAIPKAVLTGFEPATFTLTG